MTNKISKQVMELVDELAEWFGDEMLRLEERNIPIRNKEQRLREHRVIAKANISILLDDIRRARQSGKKKIS